MNKINIKIIIKEGVIGESQFIECEKICVLLSLSLIIGCNNAYAAVPDASAQQQIVQNRQQNLTSKQAQENLIRRAG